MHLIINRNIRSIVLYKKRVSLEKVSPAPIRHLKSLFPVHNPHLLILSTAASPSLLRALRSDDIVDAE